MTTKVGRPDWPCVQIWYETPAGDWELVETMPTWMSPPCAIANARMRARTQVCWYETWGMALNRLVTLNGDLIDRFELHPFRKAVLEQQGAARYVS